MVSQIAVLVVGMYIGVKFSHFSETSPFHAVPYPEVERGFGVRPYSTRHADEIVMIKSRVLEYNQLMATLKCFKQVLK